MKPLLHDACFAWIYENNAVQLMAKMESPTPLFRVAEGVLFQRLDREAVLLNMKTEQYFGLDPVGTRVWLLLTETHSVDATVKTMQAEYAVDETKLRQDVLDLADKLTAKGLLIAEALPSDGSRV